MSGITHLGFGIGLRAPHVAEILSTRPNIDWLEILTENYLKQTGPAWEALLKLRETYPLVAHGVSLSIAGTDPLDTAYLESLKRLADTLEVAYVSDHLCWTGTNGINTHDLLPVPYTEEALNHVVTRIQQVQEHLARPLVLENPSTYVEFTESCIPEAEFLAEMAKRSGCLLLLDVNNIYVSSFNHGWDADAYLKAIPTSRVAYMHMAGHDNKGTHIIDTHDHPVADAVWDLYRKALEILPHTNTLIEWDDHIPPLSVLLDELAKARGCHDAVRKAS